jgi:putative DNA primase/helicase
LAEDRAADLAILRITLEEMRTRFIAKYVPDSVDGQVRSVASRFALIGAAGELARDYGIVPWPAGEAMRAAGACFEAWLAEREDAGCGEDAAALAQVRQFLEAHGESRFKLLGPAGGSRGAPALLPDMTRITINRAGFRRWVEDDEGGRWQYLVLPETWKGEVCRGLNPKRTADLLAKRGLLVGRTERHRASVVTIPGEGKQRVYVLSGAILADDSANGAV